MVRQSVRNRGGCPRSARPRHTEPGRGIAGCGYGGRGGAVDDIHIDVDGSIQNPAWSADGEQLLATVWRGGYNVGPADVVIVSADGGSARELVADGWTT